MLADRAFERFIAIDWSGSRAPRYPGIAVAACSNDGQAPELMVAPAGGPWTRTAVRDWLLHELARGPRTLVGFDFAFALPGSGLSATALWQRVEARCQTLPDLQGHAYVDDDPRFWRKGPQPADWLQSDRHRLTEQRCAALGMGQPQSPLKLIGARQVGLASLSGMRLLQALRSGLGDRLCVWPFACPQAAEAVVVEIYPRLYIRRAGGGPRKLDASALNAALARLGAPPFAGRLCSDHESDALIAAVGLRLDAGREACWRRTGFQREGWIFGLEVHPDDPSAQATARQPHLR